MPAPKEKTIKLLTIGNSFSGNATHYLREIAAAADHEIIIGHADIGGCSLEHHWKCVEAAEADPKSEEGRPYTVTVGASPKQCSLKDILASQQWDVVTIQQYSWISNDISTYRPYAQKLRDYVRKYAPLAEVVIHQTWPYRCDDPRFASGVDTQEKMYHELSNAYRTIADELGLRVIPVGDAMYAADTNKLWRYRPVTFDPTKLKYPDLPDQTHSLHVGWQWLKDADGDYRLEMDGHHASNLGCYLAGCVWFEFIYGESVENNTFVPADIPPSDASYLRSIVHSIVNAN